MIERSRPVLTPVYFSSLTESSDWQGSRGQLMDESGAQVVVTRHRVDGSEQMPGGDVASLPIGESIPIDMSS
jgi:hypothetical protein